VPQGPFHPMTTDTRSDRTSVGICVNAQSSGWVQA
jgi:hypothetical protein